MDNQKLALRWFGILVIAAIVSICASGVYGAEKEPENAVQFRADIIYFDTVKALGDLEKPPAIFLHDNHTDALEKKNKDCSACHQSDNGRMSLKFMRLKDTGRKDLTKIYCDNCTKCHSDMIAAGDKAGPVKCEECHKKRPFIKSSRVEAGFDKSLHYRHLKAQKSKCERCHHTYDKKLKKLVYAKGKEGTCRYCHGKKTEKQDEEERISMRFASHIECIDCHQKTLAKHMDAGPLRCGGCHDPVELKKIEKIKNIPRMKMGQPDVVLIKTGDKKGKKPKMMGVPFSHKAHERYNDTCRVCHLAALGSCTGCHSLNASKDGGKPDLRTAFHKINHQSSCIGCHEKKQHDKNCAGCHAFLNKDHKKELTSCVKCHMTPLPEKTGVLSTSRAAKMARLMPALWRETFGPTYKVSVPKKVIINNLIDKYEAVEFPHRKIFNTLVKQVNKSRLARYFHHDDTTLCNGCHHNTPAAGKPPECRTCHGKPFDETNLLKPGIKGSYHRQCIGCHQQMGIKKFLSCTACHRERKKMVTAKNGTG